MKKPDTFEELCESLTKPYSTAKQYFDNVVLEIDINEDLNYFYDWYSKLDNNKQDSVYNHLTKIYSAKKEEAKYTMNSLKIKLDSNTDKLKLLNKSSSNVEIADRLDKCLDSFNKMSEIYILSSKLSLITHLLNTIDSYRRVQGAVDYKACDKRCLESKKQQDKLKILLLIVIPICGLLSLIITLVMAYIIGVAGIDNYLQFVNDNIIPLLFAGIGSLFVSLFSFFYKLYKKS